MKYFTLLLNQKYLHLIFTDRQLNPGIILYHCYNMQEDIYATLRNSDLISSSRSIFAQCENISGYNRDVSLNRAVIK